MNDITMKLNGDPLILQALREDITGEDISTNSVMPGFRMGQVELKGGACSVQCPQAQWRGDGRS